MKKAISFLLALLLMSSSFTFYSPAANALGAVWVKDYYKDKFGDKTDQCYLTNKSQFNGTYNSDSVSNGELGANLIFERDGEVLLAYLTLFLNGMDQLKNSASSNDYYDVSVKRADGSVFDTNGSMVAGENRIRIDASMELAQALRANNGVVKIYIEDSYYSNNNFLFTAECGNFDDLYNQEILVPYQEEKYQAADQLLEEKKYDEAAGVFRALGEYKDSPKRVEEIAEIKNADAYATAVTLLEQKEFEKAIKAFEALGDYKDSPARVEEAMEAKRKAADEHLNEIYKVGSIINFGFYEQDNNISNGKEEIEWIVLEKDGNNCLLISQYALDCQKFKDLFEKEDVTWETSNIRSWLNGEFLDAAFSDAEQHILLASTIKNDWNRNKTKAEDDGTDSIIDKVFLLSFSEAQSYFSTDSERVCIPTEYAVAKGAFKDRYLTGGCWWWLRSPGKLGTQSQIATVYTDGSLKVKANNFDSRIAVRPAIWIDTVQLEGALK